MADLKSYLQKRGITDADMESARRLTQEKIEAYSFRQARTACGMTQVEVAAVMGVSQNRVSRIENGHIESMSIDSIKRYVEAVGGKMTLSVDLPSGKILLV